MTFFLDILSGFCFLIGIISILVGSIGVIKLPDVYSRLHASGMIDTAGAGFLILGMTIQAGFNITAAKLLLIALFLFFTSPISGHAIALVANSMGIKPEAKILNKEKIRKKN